MKYRDRGYSRRKRQKIGGFFCILLAVVLLTMVFPPVTEAKTSGKICKSLCSSALQATGGGKYLKYMSESAMDFGALSSSARKKVKSIQYVCDDKEVYSLCVMEAKEDSGAKALLKAVKKYKKSNCASDYLHDYSAEEQRVFKNAVCGKKGRYIWYIAMSTKKAKNKKGQAAIKKQL